MAGRNAFLRRKKNIVRKNQSKTVKGGDNSKCVLVKYSNIEDKMK
jgi:hypothetical protein